MSESCKLALALALLPALLLGCGGGGSNSNSAPPVEPPPPDFTAADSWLEAFVAAEDKFPGGSMIIVDAQQGTLHKSAFGDQTEDSVVLLASTSKVPTVTLLMALDEDDANVDFDIQQPIANYLPWVSAWDPALTTENLVSNRSGIPGIVYQFTRPIAYAPHLCQYLPGGTLLECAETLYTTPLPGLPSNPADTAFDYGGSQWQISGGVAELVGGGTWRQLWDQYIAAPCGMQLAQYGNNLSAPGDWTGDPDSLVGLANPNMEGGMISNLDDYARIISLHLNDGRCGDQQVLSAQAVAFMREQRSTPEETGQERGYGMGWWIAPAVDGGSVYLYVDPGFYGSISWIDIERGYGGAVLFEEYTGTSGSVGSGAVIAELIPIIEDAIDAVR
ncbi:class C beta-lactamase-related serine hydrolase [Mangrovimicrobium sediminis]|uniref:Class C beta-lactamase-related serine hydrolase n=1 Tax=Mangrovimicrobium sediminis TaxID=2562682 RepID=A0A4Z0M5B5_9GAMM|nr:serine hydrolase [Haliea sp. SAOS-164]TGD74893.1 class C beta-lactamase-related serine hydrolase [Haliea sp. SAOS-164]